MATSVNGNKLILTARGFKRVNEKTSPELLEDDELTIMENLVLDQTTGIPTERSGIHGYNSNALSVASYNGAAKLEDFYINSNDYLFATCGTILESSLNGTGAWSTVKSGLTAWALAKIQQYGGKLFVTNGADKPFATDMVAAAYDIEITNPDISGVTCTGSNGTGSLVYEDIYLYVLVYGDKDGNVSQMSYPIYFNNSTPASSNTNTITNLPVSASSRVNKRYLYR